MLWRLSCFLKQKCKPCGSKAWAPGMILKAVLKARWCVNCCSSPLGPRPSSIHLWRVIVIECYRSQFTYHATPSSKLPCIEEQFTPGIPSCTEGWLRNPASPDQMTMFCSGATTHAHTTCFSIFLLEGIRWFVCSIIVWFDIKSCKSVGMFAIICCTYSYLNIQKISLGWWILDAFLVIIQTISSSPQKR